MKNKILTIILPLLILNLFLVSAVSIIKVSSIPKEVAPGQPLDLDIEIKNTFDEYISNLRIRLDLKDAPFAPYQSSSEKFLKELEEDEKENFEFKLIVLPSAASGIYKIPIEINYNDKEGNNHTKTELISLTVNSEPELKVSLEEAFLIKGRENALSIKIINSGLADVKFVYLTIGESTGIKFLTEREQYIGDIDSDDFDNVEYRIYVKENAPSIINLPIILKFKDATNKEFIENREINLRIYSLKEAQNLGIIQKSNYKIIYVAISSFVIVFFVYRIIRKKRKLKKKTQ